MGTSRIAVLSLQHCMNYVLFSFPCSLLEHKILEMEGKHKEELDTLKEEKENLQGLVSRQTFIIQELEKQLSRATNNNSILQKQQLELMDTVHNLISLCTKEGGKSSFLLALEIFSFMQESRFLLLCPLQLQCQCKNLWTDIILKSIYKI